MTDFKQLISQYIWENKYRYIQDDAVIDASIEDTWRRVAKAIAAVEKPSARAEWEKQFYSILEGFRFIPGGRILAGAGTQHEVTLFNCFVMNIAEDSMSGIFDALQEGALTLQQGGGVGYDFSVLRPNGALAKKTGLVSSGPVSFMQIWDSMCQVILSTGMRRGAMMGVLRCDHPDIEAFVTAKSNPALLRHFNMSVMVSDLFMQALKDDAEWALIFPTSDTSQGEIIYRQWGDSLTPVPCRVHKKIKARDLWELIIRSAYDFAEPGVLFSDTINRNNPLWYRERINATNPCGEIPLPVYGACNLGAINLTQFVKNAFTAQATLDWQSMEQVTSVATRFQDNVIDASRYPLEQQKIQATGTRRIGLGITGLADALVMLGIPYGSEASFRLAKEIMRRISTVTWQTSIELAHEKGSFPFYHPDYLKGEFVQSLSDEIKLPLAQHGIRNSHHNTIAPAGTISLLANNVSNGIEPVFTPEYERRVNDEIFKVKSYSLLAWQAANPETCRPPAWVDTTTLTPTAHLEMQAAMQPYIDNAISKTINLPKDFPFNDLTTVYTTAHTLGLKGCTIFRPNPITGSILKPITPSAPGTEECC